MRRLFEDGEEVICHDGTAKDAAGLVKKYLRMDKEREEIARRGWEKVRRRHTDINRVDQLMTGLRVEKRRDVGRHEEEAERLMMFRGRLHRRF